MLPLLVHPPKGPRPRMVVGRVGDRLAFMVGDSEPEVLPSGSLHIRYPIMNGEQQVVVLGDDAGQRDARWVYVRPIAEIVLVCWTKRWSGHGVWMTFPRPARILPAHRPYRLIARWHPYGLGQTFGEDLVLHEVATPTLEWGIPWSVPQLDP